ncbi:MAG: glycosyltransferase family 4 protein [Candidatus Rokubacteria bacterium]|nr:glycosyltransferase family 4 protein [Candidatus Rokubacteria bacterium]
MRLALICRPFVFYGGVETATAGLLGELVRQGHQVDLITTRGQPPVPGVTVRELAVPSQPSLARLLVFGIAARWAARGGRYDVVQGHERCPGQDIYRAGEGTHQGYLAAMGRRRAKVNPYHRTVMLMEKQIFSLRWAREIVAISHAGKSEIERLYATPPAKVTVVYNGVDLDRFHPGNRERLGPPTRAELALSSGAWTVLFVGSGFERKGLGPLLEGLGLMEDTKARLVVAGKGSTERYRSLSARLGILDRVVWVGPRADVERLYALADVVALPARYEPFGNVHLEALASGVPVLSSAAAGGAELIRDGDNGVVAAEVTGRVIGRLLDRLRESNPERLRERARATACGFTHAAQVEAFTRLYRRLSRNMAFH